MKIFWQKKKIYFNFEWNKREEKLAETLRPFFLALPFVVHKVKKIVDLMYYLLSFLSFSTEVSIAGRVSVKWNLENN